jgi:hypothetical protein
MPVFTVSDYKDLVTTTLNDLGRLKWTDIALDLQEYIAMSRIINKKKVKFDSGKGISWNVRVAITEAAKDVGLYNQDDITVGDGMEKAEIPWRHSTTNYGWDRRELSMNTGPAQIVDLVKEKRNGTLFSLAEHMEGRFWSKPATSADKTQAFGIQYWIVTNASEGFTGGNATGFDDGPGGLDCDTYPNWKNYSAQYTAVSQIDLIRKWRTAAMKTNFKSPQQHADYNKGNNYEYFTNLDVIVALQEYLEDRNDNVGGKLVRYTGDGDVMFMRNPVRWVPYLDVNSTDPIYGINWGVFNPVFLKNEYMREDPPAVAPNQHNVLVVHVDLTYNFRCTDRRRLFVLYK